MWTTSFVYHKDFIISPRLGLRKSKSKEKKKATGNIYCPKKKKRKKRTMLLLREKKKKKLKGNLKCMSIFVD